MVLVFGNITISDLECTTMEPVCNQKILINLQNVNIWSRRIDINNLTLAKKYLRDVKYMKHNRALEDIIAWRGFKGSKNFASPPTNMTFKVGKLSNNKFLQIFLEFVLHFNGRSLSTYHQALTIDCHPSASTMSSLETTADMPSLPRPHDCHPSRSPHRKSPILQDLELL